MPIVVAPNNVPEPFYRQYSPETRVALGRVLDDIQLAFSNMKWIPTRTRPNVSGLSHISTNMRRGEPCDSMVFGRLRKFGYPLEPSRNNENYPHVWALLQELGRLADHHYTTITINRNLVCKPHKDGNIGESIIVALGEFTGGRLYVKHPAHDKPKAYNIDRRILQFEGNICEHWTEPFSGPRYSIVFYTRKPIQVDRDEDKIFLARAIIPRTDLPEYPKRASIVGAVASGKTNAILPAAGAATTTTAACRKRKLTHAEDHPDCSDRSSRSDRSDQSNHSNHSNHSDRSDKSDRSNCSDPSNDPNQVDDQSDHVPDRPQKKSRVAATTRTFHIAIPSLKRAEVLVAKTLPMVRRLHPAMTNVTVFTSNQKERFHYQRVLARAGFDTVTVIQGKKGLLKQRRFYHKRYYNKNDLILNMDDDIDDLKIVVDGKLTSYTGTLQELVDRMASLCEAWGARLAGVYPVCNAFYMKNRHVVGLRYIVGALFLSYGGDKAICGIDRVSTESSGEDFETCIRSYLLHGNVVRLEDIAVKTDYFATDDGGIKGELKCLGVSDRKSVHEAALTRLHHAYPDITSIRQKKDVLNLRLKSIVNDVVKIE